MSSRWNYVDTECVKCHKIKKIRIDQFNRKNKQWTCRSCSRTGLKLKVSKPSIKYDEEKFGAYKSYERAKRRVKENHKNAYGHVLFLFNSFEEFWNELGKRPEGFSLDRIDVNGNYEPGNVRWASTKEQTRNKRNNYLIEFEGKLMCIADVAKITNRDPGALRRRIQSGCPKEFLFKEGRWQSKTKIFIPK